MLGVVPIRWIDIRIVDYCMNFLPENPCCLSIDTAKQQRLENLSRATPLPAANLQTCSEPGLGEG